MVEQFEWIDGYECRYRVSNLGYVESVKPTGCKRLKCYTSGKSNVGVNLYKDGKRKSYRLDKLVAKYFLPKQPEGTGLIHIDGDRKNCNSANLMWVKSKHVWRKPQPVYVYDCITGLTNSYSSINSAARAYGVYPYQIIKALNSVEPYLDLYVTRKGD